MVNERAFQDDIPDNLCWGCGPGNERGLRIRSRWVGDGESVCDWTPEPHLMAGPRGILNGGIIATVIDCHTVCTAIADAYRREGREIGSDPAIWYATGSLAVRYLAAVPIDRPLRLRARIEEVDGRKTRLSCVLVSGQDECAAADVLAIRVPAEWRHGT